MRTFVIAATLVALPLTCWAGSDSDEAHHSGMDHSNMEMEAEGGVETTATINAIEADKVNLSHPEIAEIGWPAMTMDLPLLEGAEVGEVAAGDETVVILEKGPDGMFGIRAILPVE